MVVWQKMTAIANPIRRLLGITEKMDVDAMAANLETALTDLENAYTAVGSKNGTLPEQKTLGNLAGAIYTVSTGVAVLRKSGTVQTDSSGYATVSCGFKPDLVFIHHNERDPDDGRLYNAAVSFAEETRSGTNGNSPYLAMWTRDGIYSLGLQQLDNGFYIGAWKYDESFDHSNAGRTSFTYVAVKYT